MGSSPSLDREQFINLAPSAAKEIDAMLRAIGAQNITMSGITQVRIDLSDALSNVGIDLGEDTPFDPLFDALASREEEIRRPEVNGSRFPRRTKADIRPAETQQGGNTIYRRR